MPRTVCNDGLVPPGRSQSNRENQTGVPAMINAVMPEDTFCSAQFTPPLPMPNSRAATRAAFHQVALAGAGVPLQRRTT